MLSAMALWLSRQSVALDLHGHEFNSHCLGVAFFCHGLCCLKTHCKISLSFTCTFTNFHFTLVHDITTYKIVYPWWRIIWIVSIPWWQVVWIITTGLSFVKMLFCTRVVLFTWITTVIRQFANEKVKNLYFDFYCQKLSFNIFRFYLNCMKFSLQFKLQKWLFHWILNGLNHFKPLVELNLGWAKLIWYC